MTQYMITYNYTFGADVVECETIEEATLKAIDFIKEDFPILPINGRNRSTGENVVINDYKDMIEEIFEYEDEDEN